MAANMTPYIVRQGDYLAKLAFVKGFDADTVWNDPKNEDLRKLRPYGEILAPGDVLYVPERDDTALAVDHGTENHYAAPVPKISVAIAFTDATGSFANAAYVIEGLGVDTSGTAEGDGKVTVEVPVDVREFMIAFPDKNIAFPVRVGDMDPIEETSGVRARLRHLGYPTGDDARAGDDPADLDSVGISAFQADQGLGCTGTVDDATREALVKAHGC